MTVNWSLTVWDAAPYPGTARSTNYGDAAPYPGTARSTNYGPYRDNATDAFTRATHDPATIAALLTCNGRTVYQFQREKD